VRYEDSCASPAVLVAKSVDPVEELSFCLWVKASRRFADLSAVFLLSKL
jgi:hypothetical protein